MAPDGTTALLRRLVQRPQGVSNYEAAAATGKRTLNCNILLNQLVKRGEAFPAGPMRMRRFFCTAEAARQYEAQYGGLKRAAKAICGRPPAPPAHAHVFQPPRITARDPQLDPKQPAVVPPNVVRTVASRPIDRRFAPDGPVPRVVNADECRPWAREVLK